MKTIVLIARILVILLVALFVLRNVASAQQQTQQPDRDVDAATKTLVIDTLIKELNDSYVFPETAKKMEADLRERLKNKEYDSMTSSKAFAAKITADLQSVSKDLHLRVRYSYQPIPARKDRGEPSAEEKAQFDWSNKRINFGFEKVERMMGNIGYIDLRGFNDPQAGAETVAAAMNFLANTEALIFDLRQNGGGDPEMVALISSYLFGEKPVHLNDLYWRQGNKTDEFWTKPALAAKKFANKDVYILTSKRTFSAAEEFTYNLKNLKRVTIVGETTGGGAHPGGTVRFNEHFGAFIPIGRAINPISKTNWEGTGVEPDIKVSKELALKTAYLLALKKSISTTNDASLKGQLQELVDQTQKELDAGKSRK